MDKLIAKRIPNYFGKNNEEIDLETIKEEIRRTHNKEYKLFNTTVQGENLILIFRYTFDEVKAYADTYDMGHSPYSLKK